MAITLVLRTTKGSALTYNELDTNFQNLANQALENDHIPLKVTANHVAISDNKVILGDATAGAIQIDLPTAAAAANEIFYFKKIDSSANVVTIAANGVETIDGAATVGLTTQWEVLRIISDGVEWFVL